MTHLRGHINRHLPEIIIPPIIDQFWKSQFGEANKFAINAIQSILTAASDGYDLKRNELDDKEKKVNKVVDRHKAMLERLVASAVSCFSSKTGDGNSNISFGMDGIRLAMEDIYANEPGFEEVKSEFGKTTDWIDRISRIESRVNDALVAAFWAKDADFSILDAIPEIKKTSKDSLAKRIRYMRDALEYRGDLAVNGTVIKEAEGETPSRIEALMHEIRQLTEALGQVTSEITMSTVENEKSNIRGAMDFLLRWHTERISDEAQMVADDFRLAITAIPRGADTSFAIDCKLETDFTITTKKTTKKVEYKRRPVGIWEWVKHFGGEVTDTKDIKVSHKIAQIPGIATGLQQGWSKQLEPYFQRVGTEFTGWLTGRLNECIEHARTSLQADIQKYRAQLVQSHKSQKDTFEKIQERWQPILLKAKNWEPKAEGVGGGLSSIDSLAGMWMNEKKETITIEADGSWKREESGDISSGSWQFESPILWLVNSESSGRHAWLAMAGSHIWPRNDKHDKFRRISGTNTIEDQANVK